MQLDNLYKKRWNESMAKSIGIHVFLLLIAFLLRPEINPEEKIDTQYAVTVNFQQIDLRTLSKSSNSNKSSSTSGAQRAKSEAPKKISQPKPSAVPVPKPTPPKPTPTPPVTDPQPTDPVISESTTEESDIQAVEEPIDVEDPEPEYIPQEAPEPTPVEETIVLDPDIPTIEDIIGDITDDPIELEEEPGAPSDSEGSSDEASSRPGSSSNDPSLKDGDGSGRGNSGDGRGSDASGDDGDSGLGSGGYGEGEFDDSGDGIFGRKVIYRDPSILNNTGKSGKIVFKVCINRRGIVSYIEINEFETTIDDPKILRGALESMRKYKFEIDNSAPREQCGKYSVIIDNFQGIRGG